MTLAVLLVEPDDATAAEITSALEGVGGVTWHKEQVASALSDFDVVVVGPGVPVRGTMGICQQAADLIERPVIVSVCDVDYAETRARLLIAGANAVLGISEVGQIADYIRDAFDRTVEPGASMHARAAGIRTRRRAQSEKHSPDTSPASRTLLIPRSLGIVAILAVGVLIAGGASVLLSRPSTGPDVPVPPATQTPTDRATPVFVATASAPAPSIPAAPTPSRIPVANATPTPEAVESPTTAPVSPTPASTPPSPEAPPGISRLPVNPQRVRIILASSGALCEGAQGNSVTVGDLAQPETGTLRLTMAGHTNIGTLAPDGVFDMAGVDPFAHWHGRLSASGGAAEYELVTVSGCKQLYTATLVFV